MPSFFPAAKRCKVRRLHGRVQEASSPRATQPGAERDYCFRKSCPLLRAPPRGVKPRAQQRGSQQEYGTRNVCSPAGGDAQKGAVLRDRADQHHHCSAPCEFHDRSGLSALRGRAFSQNRRALVKHNCATRDSSGAKTAELRTEKFQLAPSKKHYPSLRNVAANMRAQGVAKEPGDLDCIIAAHPLDHLSHLPGHDIRMPRSANRNTRSRSK